MKISARALVTRLAALLLAVIFLRPAYLTAATDLVSMSTAGDFTFSDSQSASVDATGRYVAFESVASNLVNKDFVGNKDVFLRDRTTGITSRLSRGFDGQEANDDSYGASASSDGRYVAFASDATNLVPGDTNNATDVFVYNRQTGKTIRASVRTGGGQALGGSSRFPVISGNGRYVVFMSGANNLVPNDTNGLDDVFVRDLKMNVTTRVSIHTGGAQTAVAPLFSSLPAVSYDGRYIAFSSASSDLVDADSNNSSDIFLHDRLTKTTTLASLTGAGIQINGFSNVPSLSGDGTALAFISNAANLPGSNGQIHVYVRDLRTNAVTKARAADTYSYSPNLSADGKRVTFVSKVGSAMEQVEVVDRNTSQVFQPARPPSGSDTVTSSAPSLSADGRVVVFESTANGISPLDSNGKRDVFARPLFDTIGFSQAVYATNEGNGNVSVTIQREGVLDQGVSVRYAVSAPDDTAAPGVDYTAAVKTGTLSWAAGDSSSRTLTFPLINTSIADGYRAFTVALTTPTGGAVLGTATALVVIRDTESDPVENHIGHRLKFTRIVALGTDWFDERFRASFTIQNPAPFPSFPGFVEVRFGGNVVANANFAPIPAHGQVTVIANADVGDTPDGTVFGVLFETTDDGPVLQDSGFGTKFTDNNTAPPSGGATQPNSGVKAPGLDPITIKTIAINGTGTVNEGSAADYTVTVTLSDNTTLPNVSPTWGASLFSINSAGHFTAGDVAANKPVTLSARVVRNGIATTKTRTITVLNVPATPVITSSAAAFATRGKPFTYKIVARHEPTSFDATGLPDGLTVSATTGLISGTPTVANTFNAQMLATNAIGTDTNPLTITVSEPSPLTVNISGSGTVAPDLNGQLLDVGKTFKLLAKPSTGQLFAGWSGGIVSAPPLLTLVMTPNLTLTATFVANPYLDRSGVYAGLVQSSPPSHESGGLIQVTVSKTGLCTGKLVLGGKPIPFKTTLDFNGMSPSMNLSRPGGDPVTFSLSLDVVTLSGAMSGNLTSGPINASISAGLVEKDSSAIAGRYTVVLPGPAAPSADGATPDGSGFGTVIISATGKVKLTGVLGDGTPFSQAGVITVGEVWPFYVPLYSGQGSIFGFVDFVALATSDFNSQLAWFKPARPADPFYPAGWSAGIGQDFRGARFASPPVLTGLPAPDTDGNASIQFSGGGLLGSQSQALNITDSGVMTFIQPPLAKLTLSINKTTGLFKGAFLDPSLGQVRIFSGAIQQKLSTGEGVFRGTSQRAGNVILKPAP